MEGEYGVGLQQLLKFIGTEMKPKSIEEYSDAAPAECRRNYVNYIIAFEG